MCVCVCVSRTKKRTTSARTVVHSLDLSDYIRRPSLGLLCFPFSSCWCTCSLGLCLCLCGCACACVCMRVFYWSSSLPFLGLSACSFFPFRLPLSLSRPHHHHHHHHSSPFSSITRCHGAQSKGERGLRVYVCARRHRRRNSSRGRSEHGAKPRPEEAPGGATCRQIEHEHGATH